MKSKTLFPLRWLALWMLPLGLFAQEPVAPAIVPEPADDAPLAFPPLEHYAKLWENSLFTTKALPPPDDEPKGPLFTDSLSLAGVYEVDGAIAAVLVNKSTSLITEVRIGAENEEGLKIVRVNPGATPDKTRIQLQKGTEFGWVTFAAESASAPADEPTPAGTVSPVGSAIPGRPAAEPPPNIPNAVPPQLRNPPAQPAPAPTPTVPNDIPLPPP
jgi:hypothetical protein